MELGWLCNLTKSLARTILVPPPHSFLEYKYRGTASFMDYISRLLGDNYYLAPDKYLWNTDNCPWRLRGLAEACLTIDHYHPCSNSGVGISEGCLIFHFVSLPLEVLRPIWPTLCTKVAVKHQTSSSSSENCPVRLHHPFWFVRIDIIHVHVTFCEY